MKIAKTKPTITNLVIDVSDVHDVEDVILEIIFQDPPHDVKGDVGPKRNVSLCHHILTEMRWLILLMCSSIL